MTARRGQAGFTLIELLVSMSIVTFVVMATISAFVSFHKNERVNRLQNESQDEARLTVERLSPVHPVGLEQGQSTLTRAQAEELLKGGTERARQHCAAEASKGNYHPGCPVQSKYY